MRRCCHQVEGHTVHWIIIVVYIFYMIFKYFFSVRFTMFSISLLNHCSWKFWKSVVFFHFCSSVHLCPVWRLCGCLTAFPLWCMSSGTERRNGRGTVKHLSSCAVARRDTSTARSDASLAKSSSLVVFFTVRFIFSCPSGKIWRDFGSQDFATA